jgi:hypothetical protein
MSMRRYVYVSICQCVYMSTVADLEGGVWGVRPPPPKIRKAYVIQR